MIEVRLFATFRIGRQKKYQFDSKEYQNVQQILDVLGINTDEVSILLINGIHSQAIDMLVAGDVVSLFPPVGGG